MNTIKQFGILLMAAVLLAPLSAQAASKDEIDAKVKATLVEFYDTVKGGKELAGKAHGVLVFPEILKGGVGIGGEYGEGALLIKGKTVGYYNTIAASVGLQFGAQFKSQVILFMTASALKKFRNSKGWKAGVDGSVALATLGADGSVDTNTAKKEIIGFIFSNKGLMYNLTFEGAKISRIKRK